MRTSLYQYVKFYRKFPKIVQTASGHSRPPLSWSHYIELLRVEDPEARAWYEREAAGQMWSVQTLSRNISTQWYHRLLANHADLGTIPNVGMPDMEAYAEHLAYIKNPVICSPLTFIAGAARASRVVTGLRLGPRPTK